MLFRAKSTLLLAAVLCAPLVQLVLACPDNPLTKLESYLKDKVSSSDVGENLEELKKYQGEPKGSFSLMNKVTIDGTSQEVLKAIEMSESPKCSKDEYETLNTLDIISPKQSGKETSECFGRIVPVLNEIIKRHVTKCVNTHERNVFEAVWNMGEDSTKGAYTLINKLLNLKADSSNEGRPTYAEATELLNTETLLKPDTVMAIKELIFEGPSREDLANNGAKDAFELTSHLLDKYLLNGCDQLVESTDDFAAAALFDVRLGFPGFRGDQAALSRYLKVLSANYLCKVALSESEQLIKRMLRSS